MVRFLMPMGQQQFLDGNGDPLAGGTVTTYVPDTLTLKTTWLTPEGDEVNENPILLDADGRAVIWSTGSYRQIVKDSLGNTIWDEVVSVPSDPDGLDGYTVIWGDRTTGTANARIVQAQSAEIPLILDEFEPGTLISWTSHAANTAAVTIQMRDSDGINVGAPKDLTKFTASGPEALVANDLVTDNTYVMIFADDQWQLVNYVQTASVADGSITNAKLANMAQATIKGRQVGGGTGAPEDLTATQVTAVLNAFVGDSGSGGTKGLVPAPAAGDAAADKFLKASGAWDTVPGGGGGAPTDVEYLVATSDAGLSAERVTTDANGVVFDYGTAGQVKLQVVQPQQIAISDTATPITAAVSAVKVPVPMNFFLNSVQGYVGGISATGLEFDVLYNGASVLSTLITIDGGESNSLTAAVQPVVGTDTVAAGGTWTFECTNDGDGNATGAIITLLGYFFT